jgi:hypothetical protein
MIGHQVNKVAIDDAYNKTSITEAGILKEASHKKRLNFFLRSL